MSTELNLDQINELLSSSRSRGEYDAEFAEFLKSGQAGVEIDLKGGRFAGKRAKQVKIGFDNVRKKTNEQGRVHQGGENVQVIAVSNDEDPSQERVVLVNKALLGNQATPEQPAMTEAAA